MASDAFHTFHLYIEKKGGKKDEEENGKNLKLEYLTYVYKNTKKGGEMCTGTLQIIRVWPLLAPG